MYTCNIFSDTDMLKLFVLAVLAALAHSFPHSFEEGFEEAGKCGYDVSCFLYLLIN